MADAVKRNRVSGPDFVRAYIKVQKADGTNEDLARETGLVYGSVVQRIKAMTDAGAVLPPLKRKSGGNRVNVAELQALIDELSSEVSDDSEQFDDSELSDE